jgi:hypothetical protein
MHGGRGLLLDQAG